MNQYTKEPIPNLAEAVQTVTRLLTHFDTKTFYSEYTPQMVTTNELSHIYNLKQHIKPGASVLTVGGSGEQPLFCKMYGADNVVTFDVSYNSYLLTSVKIAALQAFDKNTDYEKFVYDLSHYCKPGQLMDTPKLNYVMPYLTYAQKNHLRYTDEIGIPVFLGDISCDFYCIPQQQYEILRQSVKTPFPFIWTNITELDKKLGNENFDLVYYSNILSFLEPQKIAPVLESTKKHINPGGSLFLLSEFNEPKPAIMNTVRDVFENASDWNIDFKHARKFGDFHDIIIKHCQNSNYR